MSRLRVLIVDDSALIRKVLRSILGSIDGVEVVGEANDGRAGLEAIRALNPDLVTLDVEMPVLDGLGVLRELRKENASPRVLMISTLTGASSKTTVEALCLGAWDFLKKPGGSPKSDGRSHLREELSMRIEALRGERPCLQSKVKPAPQSREQARVVGIGISTGGPRSLHALLKRLPADFSLPILIVQHMPAGLTEALAQSLDEACALQVHEARSGMRVQAGQILLAPGGRHMEVFGSATEASIRISDGPAEKTCRPSVNVLLRSISRIYGPGSAGLIMTGIGDDGLEGCRSIANAGGRVLAQDEASSVVYGMPRCVVDEGLAQKVCSLDDLPGALSVLAGKEREAA